MRKTWSGPSTTLASASTTAVASASLTTARVCSGSSSSTWTPWSSPTLSHRSCRRTRASSCWASVKVRSVPVTRAEVGTTLTAVPAWIVPALQTQSVSS